MNRIRLLLPWLCFCLFENKVASDDVCATLGHCHIFEWKSWEPCTGLCGHQTQKRSRLMCCPKNVIPATEQTCLLHCKLSDSLHESRPCHKCIHGTPTSTSTCQCDLRYRGSCCEENCSVAPDCTVCSWGPWTPCTGVCGLQQQYRFRHMCCSVNVKPHNLNTCLIHCNRSLNFPMKMGQSCRTCKNGGMLHVSPFSCICDPHFKGACCQEVNMKSFKVLLLICTLFTDQVFSFEDCIVEPDCNLFDWLPWTKCTGNCGAQSQYRIRHMCCSQDVKPHTLENCLVYCNRSITFPMNVSQPCRTCKHGGVLNISSSSCICDLHHSGECCQDLVTCQDHPCKHGTCSDTNATFVCNCDRGYKGVDCNTRKKCSDGVTCDKGGTCRDVTNGFKCQCRSKYGGEFCQKALTCSDNPCKNTGLCTNQGGSFTCKCPYTHKGDTCETVKTCADNPCQNGGVCTDTSPGFTCACPATYKGLTCKTAVTCSDSPCLHGGTCANKGTSYQCTCPSIYKGQRCEKVVTCSDTPCLHGGTCVPKGTSFQCTCPSIYKGQRCEIVKTCADSPCKNSGHCMNKNPTAFTCTCPDTHKGIICQTVIKCVDTPCVHGSCTDTGSGFTCSCDPKFTGILCNKPIQCSPNPCLHGTCSTSPSGYNCHCDEKYTGEKCDTPILCSSLPCQHGTCTDTPTGYKCTCDVKYTGSKCDTLRTCTSSPCLHGTCTDSASGFVCSCDESYTGVTCETLLTTDEASEILLPKWLPYLEYAVLSMTSLVGLMVAGCVCLKCCQACGVIDNKDDDDDDKEEEEEYLKKYRRDSVFPLTPQKSGVVNKSGGLNF